MKTYLDRKGIKFEDERLNKVINLVSLAKGGKEVMDFLLSHLTNEAIEAMNAKRYIVSIPLKKGCLMESMLDDVDDPSFNTTMQFLMIVDGKNNFHQFSFNLSYFHDKSVKSNPICICDTGVLKVDEAGNGIKKIINADKSLFFHIINENKSTDGLLTLVGGEKSKFRRDYLYRFDMDKLFEFIRSDLKSRNYYQRLDKETYRLYYPGKYEYYNTEEQLKIGDVLEKVALTYDLSYDIDHRENNEKESAYMELNMLMRGLDETDYSEFVNYISLDEYLKKHNLKKFPFIDFDEWIKDKGSIVHVEETSDIPLFNKQVNKQESTYKFYNPNKMRYEDEEEEVIAKKR